MSFTKAFQGKIRAVGVRCGVNLLLGQTGRILVGAGVSAVLAVLAQRLPALTIVTPAALGIFWGGVAVVEKRDDPAWAEEWKKLQGLGQAGRLLGQRAYPWAVAVDPHRRAFGRDAGNNRIQVWQL